MIKRHIWSLIALFFLSVSAHGQTTVTGHTKFPDNSAPTNVKICFTLINYSPNVPKVVGTGVIVSQKNFCITPASDGSFSTSLLGNDIINPTATNWRVDFLWNGQQQSSATYLINHSPFNLDTEIPLSSSTPAGPNQLILNVFSFTQLTPSTTWTIPHNFNDSNTIALVAGLNGNDIYPDTKNCRTDPNNCIVTFVTPTAGFAIAMHAGAINIATNQPNAIVANPIGAQVIGGGQPITFQGPVSFTNTLNLTNPGDFTNSSGHVYHSVQLGCDPVVQNALVQGGTFATSPISGCVATPIGASQVGVYAVAGYATSSADSASRTKANTAPLYGQCLLLANNAACWGSNQVCLSANTGLTGLNCSGDELDMNLGDSYSFWKGFYLTGLDQGGTLPATATGFELATPYQVPIAFISDRHSAAVGLQLNDQLSTNPSQSQSIQFISHDNVGPGIAHIAQINEDANGNIIVIPGGGGGYSFNVNGGGFFIPNTASGSVGLLPNATGSNFQTLPPSTGTLADINLAQSWTGNQSNVSLLTPTIGGGSTLNAVYLANGLSLNSAFTSITAGTCQEQTLTLTGAATTGVASVQPTATPGANFSWSSRVSATNTISVRLCAGSTATPTSVTWNASVIQ